MIKISEFWSVASVVYIKLCSHCGRRESPHQDVTELQQQTVQYKAVGPRKNSSGIISLSILCNPVMFYMLKSPLNVIHTVNRE